MAVTATPEGNPLAPTPYVDRKRYLWPLSILWPATPMIGIYLATATGLPLFYAFTLFIWYGLIPILDALFPEDDNNPPEDAVIGLDEDLYYRILPRLTVPIHFASLVFCAWWVGTHSLAWWQFLAIALSLGVVNGLAINTGHELGHKKEAIDRWLAKIVLSVVGYGHFFIEHNKGHHRDVATPDDPATSRMGESIYKFALREIPGAFMRAWHLEKNRLQRRGKSVWNLDNEILQPLLITVPLYAGLIYLYGPIMLLFLPIQAAWGWWILTSANYIEHYGLLREMLPNGKYEKCQPRHSWNSNHQASNLILFHLQRHSDHHAHPARRYQSLRNFDDLPQLPTGYGGMFGVVFFPPLFRRLMDHRVLKWADGDLGKIQIDAAARERIIRKYGR